MHAFLVDFCPKTYLFKNPSSSFIGKRPLGVAPESLLGPLSLDGATVSEDGSRAQGQSDR